MACQFLGPAPASEMGGKGGDGKTKEDETEKQKTKAAENGSAGREPSGRRRSVGQSSERTLGPAIRIKPAAKPTLSRSPVKNGKNPTFMASDGFPPSSASWAIPPA